MIPLAKDVRECVGAFANKVENRSLLFQKMVLGKSWGHEARFDDASKFNVLRASHEGDKILAEERKSADKKANSQNAEEHVKEQARYRSKVAGALASLNVNNDVLAQSRIRSTLQFQANLAKSYEGRCVTFSAKLGGRLLINMAGGVMENSGIALDRITGLPLILGSAIKGITRHTALWEIRNRQNDPGKQTLLLRRALAIFGFCANDIGKGGDFLWAAHGSEGLLSKALQDFETETYKGICGFLTAHPSNADKLHIIAEVLTPHFDNNPRPIFFPAVEAGSEFAFAIVGLRSPHLADLDRQQLLDQTKKWLQTALTQSGIGAKTGAGYGWFKIDPQAEERQQQIMQKAAQDIVNARDAAAKIERENAEAEADAVIEAKRVAQLSDRDRFAEEIEKMDDQGFNGLAKKIADEGQDKQLAFFDVLQGKEKKDRRKQWKKSKAELWAALTEIAKKYNIELS